MEKKNVENTKFRDISNEMLDGYIESIELAAELTDFMFPKIWKKAEEDKSIIDNMNKKELAETMFQNGAMFMLIHLVNKKNDKDRKPIKTS